MRPRGAVTLALLFPGQGSQRAGMFDVFAEHSEARAVFDEAANILGRDPRVHQDEASLRSTVHAQIALFTSGVASARVLAGNGVVPAMVAGHSVGAFAAAVCAGALPFDAALRAVEVRARAMETAFPSGYGMGVISGISEPSVRACIEDARQNGDDVFVANVNAPMQVVVGGAVAAIGRVLDQARAMGARRAERLAVAVPSHGAPLEPVARAVRAALDGVRFSAPRITYLSATSARRLREGDTLRDDLSDGVAREVRWDETARLALELGATLFVEAVPGRVLTDLATAANDRIRAEALESAGVRSIVALVEKMRTAE